MRKLLGASIGSCVHVAGVHNFLRIAEKEGYEAKFLGGAVDLETLVKAISDSKPDLVALGYRLSAESARALLVGLRTKLAQNNLLNCAEFIFGGTVETSAEAIKFDFISRTFDGTEDPEESLLFLRRKTFSREQKFTYPQSLRERVEYKKPYPLFRHHIGLASVNETAENIKLLAESGLLDIISVAPDQNCQQYYFDQKKIDANQDGAGGVPLRSEKDFICLYEASRCGNYPLVRCYSGTTHLVKFSDLLKRTLNNAWAAIPLLWYSELDRRSERDLLTAIKENQKAIRWNAANGVPVEVTESHQWALRYSHDALEVAMAYIAGYNAKKLGVSDYVAQFMLMTPPGISPSMDIAKMLAKIDLLDSITDDSFHVYRMIRPGLLAFPADEAVAKSTLASLVYYGTCLKPDIIHVVAYCEAVRRATHKEIIESVKIAKGAYNLARRDTSLFAASPQIQDRKEKLKMDAEHIIEALKSLGRDFADPLTEPEVLYGAVKAGILDAPCLREFSVARGNVTTQVLAGCSEPVDDRGDVIGEKQRIRNLGYAYDK